MIRALIGDDMPEREPRVPIGEESEEGNFKYESSRDTDRALKKSIEGGDYERAASILEAVRGEDYDNSSFYAEKMMKSLLKDVTHGSYQSVDRFEGKHSPSFVNVAKMYNRIKEDLGDRDEEHDYPATLVGKAMRHENRLYKREAEGKPVSNQADFRRAVAVLDEVRNSMEDETGKHWEEKLQHKVRWLERQRSRGQ